MHFGHSNAAFARNSMVVEIGGKVSIDAVSSLRIGNGDVKSKMRNTGLPYALLH